MKKWKGPHIVLDGLDASGKTKQTDMLIERIKSEGIEYLEPSVPDYNGPQSFLVKKYMNGNMPKKVVNDPYLSSEFFTLDRAVTYYRYIKESHENGDLLLTNRWTSSNIIFQGAKLNSALEKIKYAEYMLNREYNEYGLSKPDLTIMLLVHPDRQREELDERTKSSTGRRSNTKRDIHEEQAEFQLKVRDALFFYSEYYNWSIIETYDEKGDWLGYDEIHAKVYELVEPYLKLAKIIQSNRKKR